MSGHIPFLDDLRHELMEHAPRQVETTPAMRRVAPRLSGVWVAVAVFVATLLVGGITWVLSGGGTSEEPAQPGPGPELEWRQTDVPNGVERIRSMWTGSEGAFVVWTGSSIWTSPDGESWEMSASSPPLQSLNQARVVTLFGDDWLVGGFDSDGGPAVARYDGSSWTVSSLAVPPIDNDLLVSRSEIIALAEGPDGVVAVGYRSGGPNEEAIIENYAPDLINGGNVHQTEDGIEILEPDGTPRATIPYAEIHPRLGEGGGLILDTVIWHSQDATSWQQVDLIEEAGPGFLGGDSSSYLLTLSGDIVGSANRVVTSDDGSQWSQLVELPPGVDPRAFTLFDGDPVGGGQGPMIRVTRDGEVKTITGAPDFSTPDLTDLSIVSIASGPRGLAVGAYDHTVESTPSVAIWYSPDGQRWSRQEVTGIFGGPGNVMTAVGRDRVLAGFDPNGETGSALDGPIELWVGVPGD